jgi:hypothetical protein
MKTYVITFENRGILMEDAYEGNNILDVVYQFLEAYPNREILKIEDFSFKG